MLITATELKSNIGKYLALASTNTITITKNGKEVAKLTGVAADRLAALDKLVGIVPAETLLIDDIKADRLKRQ